MTVALDSAPRLSPEAALRVTPGLFVSRRGSSVLVVEPESASWCVLDESRWNILSRIGRGKIGASEWDEWARLDGGAGPVAVRDVEWNDQLGPEAFEALVVGLHERNMVSIDGASFLDTSKMWQVQRYPHYYNLHMTEACNLACTYCRVYSPKQAPMMSAETCRLIVRRCLEEIPAQTALISFHGGEPMLNMEAIEAGCVEAKRVGEALGKEFRLLMQTNGTLLGRRNVETLKNLGVSVGVSLDGPQKINDATRVFHTGKGSHFNVMRGVASARAGGLHPGFLAVVHDPAHYVEVLDHLVREMGARSVRINYSAAEGRAHDALDFPVDRADRFAREWLKMVDYAVEYQRETGVWLDISDVNLFITHLVSKTRPHMCYRSPCGVGNSILGFSHEGEIFLCEEAMGNPLFRLGDVRDPSNLKDLLDHSPQKKWLMETRTVESLSKCSTCSWRRFHGAGCASKTYAYFGTVLKEDPMCRFYHVIFEELMWRLWSNPELVNLAHFYLKGPNAREDAVHALRM